MESGNKYDYSFLKKYNGVSVIYGLFTESQGIKYIGHSTNVYKRFYNHLYNHESQNNDRKRNWINKYKSEIRILILSENHNDWEEAENKYIGLYKKDLFNVCEGGKNNFNKMKRLTKPTIEEDLLAINKSLRELNKYYVSIGKSKRFQLFSKQDIHNISNGIYAST
jgi:hypothetical protein